MSDIGIFTTADVAELAAAFLLLIFVPCVAGARRLIERNRVRWAGHSPEEVWRRLVAARIVEAPLFVLVAGAVYATLRLDSAIPTAFYAIPAVFLLAGFAQAWRCARQTRRGWTTVQEGTLARRARRLAGAAGAMTPVETPA